MSSDDGRCIAPVTGDSFRKRVEMLIGRVGSQAELARKSGLSDRAIRDYLTGKAKPKGENAQRLVSAASTPERRVRLAWLVTGAEPMEESAGASVEQQRAAYQAINLEALAAAIAAVEARMPLAAPEGKAGKVAACYDHAVTHGSWRQDVLTKFLDLIAPAVPAPAQKVDERISTAPGEHRLVVRDQETRTRQRTPGKKRGHK